MSTPSYAHPGMTAGIDLALVMVEADHGAVLTLSVARKLVVYHRRAGGQSQFSATSTRRPCAVGLNFRHGHISNRLKRTADELMRGVQI